MRQWWRWCAVVLCVVLSASVFAQVVVSNSNMQGWTLTASSGVGNVPPPATYLAPGFEVPPLGDGSVHFNVGQDGNDAAQARTNNFTGVRIDAITALSYSTFTQVGSGNQAPYLIFHVDTDGDLGTADVQLWFFEPLYQGPAFFPSNPQTPPTVDTWQSWDALNGGWYTTGGLAGSGPGANVKSITALLAVAPNATIVTSGTGGVRIVTGFGAGPWNDYVGAADAFRFATASSDVTYDFEPDATTVVTVTPTMLEEWTLTTVDGGPPGGSPSSTIVPGPGTPPLPPGSLRLAVGPDGEDAAEARSDRWDGLFLRDLNALTYDTFHQSGGSGGQLPYIILRVDYDNNGTQDDLLFFEPVYQDGTFCPSNPQAPVASGTWQSWNAADGCWWSLSGTAGATPGAGVKPLSAILAVQPDARLVTGATGGSFRIVAGFGAGAWDNFIGFADNVNVALAPIADTTYDFDPDPSIIIDDEAANEGAALPVPFTFDLTLSHAVSYPVTVQYSTADGTATVADGDYVAETAQTATFAANTTTTTLTVDVNGDLKFEPNETFFVNLSAPVGATIADPQAQGTILNDDIQPIISIGDRTLAEGNAGTTNFVFNVTLSNPSVQTITVDFTTADGTAIAPGDYGATSGTVTFDPGEVAQTITVGVAGETMFEADETFFVNLTNPTNATIFDAQGLGTITNDDAQPQISIDNVTLDEGDAGTTNFVFNVTLSNASDSTITVDFATANSLAIAPGDYAALSGTLTFAPGDVLETITVEVVGETVFEGDETFFVNLSNPTNATVFDSEGLGFITNDDTQPQISISDVTLAEGDAGTTNFVFTVTLSNPSADAITVEFTTADGTAIAPGDYATNFSTLAFVFGDVSETITVAVVGDTMFEGDETFFVNLTNPSNATILDAQGVGTITNDDTEPTISISDVALAEGNAGTTNFVFNVTLSNPSASIVTATFTTADNTAIAPGDYGTTAGTVTFNPGVVLQTITVPVVGDTTFESDETFFVNLTNPGNATILDAQGLGTIQNDEGLPTASINDVTLAEGNAGTTNFVFNVTLTNPSATTITIDFATANNTAIAPGDYGTTSGTLTFDPGETVQTITVPVVGDTTFEPDETFFVNLTNPVGTAFTDSQGLGTIATDDGLPLITIDDVTLAEGNTGTTDFVFTVTLSNASGSTVTVNYSTALGTAVDPGDFTTTSGMLTFAPGETTKTITVPVIGDTTFEPDETFNLNLFTPVGAVVTDGTGVGTILNDDAVPAILIDDVTLAEGNSGTTDFVFNVTLSGASSTPITVDFTTADGTAIAPGDYATTAGTLTFAPGTLLQTITVPVNGDTALEPNETFFVNLSNPGGATIADNQGTGTITNDDGPVADLTLTKSGPVTVAPSSAINYLITVSNAGPQPATNVVVTDVIPAGTTFVSATPSQGTCSGTTTVTCTLGTINNGASATITLVVTAPPTAGAISNTATATASEADTTPAAATAPTVVAGAAHGESIPTVSEWGLIAMLIGLAAAAALKLRA